MNKIPSFQKNHDTLSVGLYLSAPQNGVSTFDLRFKKPNMGDYLSPNALHTIEHLLATVLRNSREKENIVYFGPMGCRTGFYLLTVNLNFHQVLTLLKESIPIALSLEEIPGSRREECGNYLAHDLPGAKKELFDYLQVLNSIQDEEEIL